jgi:hypothetical protein
MNRPDPKPFWGGDEQHWVLIFTPNPAVRGKHDTSFILDGMKRNFLDVGPFKKWDNEIAEEYSYKDWIRYWHYDKNGNPHRPDAYP